MRQQSEHGPAPEKTAATQEPRTLIAFFLLAFGISWLVWIPAALAARGLISFPLSSSVVGLLGSFGPSLAALLVTAVIAGLSGLRQLLGRLFIWRVNWRWYLFVLLWPAVLSLAATAVYALFGGTTPDLTQPPVLEQLALPPEMTAVGPWPLLPFIFLQQLLVGSAMGEEIGWRGFALPRLQAGQGALWASVTLGVLWGIWHLPLYLTQGHPLSEIFFGWTLLGIVADTILFTWVYNHTGGSLLLALLFHAAIAVTGLFLPGTPANLPIALVLKWAVVGLILYRTGRQLGWGNAP